MTATLNRPDEMTTESVAEAQVTVTDVPAEPVEQDFTVGTITVRAKDEAEALTKYKRLVRAESLKAQADMGWCQSGTNERLQRLGVRLIGEGVAIRVTVTAERTAYIRVDADNKEEALALIASDPEQALALSAGSTPSGGWKLTAARLPGDQPDPMKGNRAVGDVDDSTHAIAADGNWVDNNARTNEQCQNYHAGSYCTRHRGHEGNHGIGGGTTFTRVWE